MRVLVVGGGGQVGRAAVRLLTAQHEVIVKTRADLDIVDESAVARCLAESQPDWILNAAAYTAVDLAEIESSQAFSINESAPGALAKAARATATRLIHLSTDFVFDGRAGRPYLPADTPNPLSAYGKSKLAGETRVLQSGGNHIILRTAWIYAAVGRNFVLTMLRLMNERDEVRVVCDQIGTPTWATSVAEAIKAMIECQAPAGIYHWTDLGVASWYDFAAAIQEEALDRGLISHAVPIVPITTEEYPARAQRPAFSVLNCGAARGLLSIPTYHWRESLRAMLDELRSL